MASMAASFVRLLLITSTLLSIACIVAGSDPCSLVHFRSCKDALPEGVRSISRCSTLGSIVLLEGADLTCLTPSTFSAIRSIAGDVQFSASKYPQRDHLPLILQQFQELQAVGGDVRIRANAPFGDVVLRSLSHVGGDLEITNTLMSSIDLPSLRVVGSVVIAHNSRMRSIALASLERVVVGGLDVHSNVALESCADFGGLLEVRAGVKWGDNGALVPFPAMAQLQRARSITLRRAHVEHVPEFSSLTSLHSLTTVSVSGLRDLGSFPLLTSISTIMVDGCGDLHSIGSFPLLESVWGSVSIANAPLLESVQGLCSVHRFKSFRAAVPNVCCSTLENFFVGTRIDIPPQPTCGVSSCTPIRACE